MSPRATKNSGTQGRLGQNCCGFSWPLIKLKSISTLTSNRLQTHRSVGFIVFTLFVVICLHTWSHDVTIVISVVSRFLQNPLIVTASAKNPKQESIKNTFKNLTSIAVTFLQSTVQSPLFSRIFIRSLNERIGSRENWTPAKNGIIGGFELCSLSPSREKCTCCEQSNMKLLSAGREGLRGGGRLRIQKFNTRLDSKRVSSRFNWQVR